MAAKQPRDAGGSPVPVLRFRSGAAQKLTSVTSSAAQRTSAFTTRTQVIPITADAALYFATGASDVTATSSMHYLAAGVPMDLSLGADIASMVDYHTHASFIAVSDTGTVYISERE